jgi:hypothetical protein
MSLQDTIHDLSNLKLSPEEQVGNHAAPLTLPGIQCSIHTCLRHMEHAQHT